MSDPTLPPGSDPQGRGDVSLGFANLVELHRVGGTGHPLGEKWTFDELGTECEVDERSIRNWVDGLAVPGQTNFKKLCRGFKLLPRAGADDKRSPVQRIWAKVLESAWDAAQALRNARKQSIEQGDSFQGPIGLAYEFPKNLPADLDRRRDAVRAAVNAVLDAGCNDKHHGALYALKLAWPEHSMPSPSSESLAEEAEDMLIGLAKAIISCNSARPPWLHPPAGSVEGACARRRQDCRHLAKLLSAMIWSESAWSALPTVGRVQRLEQVTSPQLLHAGYEASLGRLFDLPARSIFRADGGWQDDDWRRWHAASNGLTRLGVGKDRDEQLLRLFGEALGIDPPARHADLPKYERKIKSAVSVRSKLHGGRVFVVSEQFDLESDPGIAELFAFAQRMACLPLAYDGNPAAWIRGDEFSILVAIEEIQKAIALIP